MRETEVQIGNSGEEEPMGILYTDKLIKTEPAPPRTQTRRVSIKVPPGITVKEDCKDDGPKFSLDGNVTGLIEGKTDLIPGTTIDKAKLDAGVKGQVKVKMVTCKRWKTTVWTSVTEVIPQVKQTWVRTFDRAIAAYGLTTPVMLPVAALAWIVGPSYEWEVIVDDPSQPTQTVQFDEPETLEIPPPITRFVDPPGDAERLDAPFGIRAGAHFEFKVGGLIGSFIRLVTSDHQTSDVTVTGYDMRLDGASVGPDATVPSGVPPLALGGHVVLLRAYFAGGYADFSVPIQILQ
jgi:hypothetical protein